MDLFRLLWRSWPFSALPEMCFLGQGLSSHCVNALPSVYLAAGESSAFHWDRNTDKQEQDVLQMPGFSFLTPTQAAPTQLSHDKQKRLEAKQGQISRAELHERGTFTIKTLELFYRNGQTSVGLGPKNVWI